MVKDNKHNSNDPTIRGGSRKSEMDLKKKLYKKSGGRPARLKKLLLEQEADEQAELAKLQKEIEDKVIADAKDAEKPKKKSSKKKKK